VIYAFPWSYAADSLVHRPRGRSEFQWKREKSGRTTRPLFWLAVDATRCVHPHFTPFQARNIPSGRNQITHQHACSSTLCCVVDTWHVHDVTTLFHRLSRAYFFVCIFLYIRAQRGRQRSSRFFALTLAVLGTLSIYMHGCLPSPLLC
jgi:hypothetical protein